MFNFLFLTSLIIFLLGVIYKVSNWFVKKIAAPGQTVTTFQRVRSAAGGILGILFSVKLIIVIKVILVDVLLQGRVFKEDVTRWLAHMLIFFGFLAIQPHSLMLMIQGVFPAFEPGHAIPGIYRAYLFVADILAVLVLVGFAYALYRRVVVRPGYLTMGTDANLIILFTCVIVITFHLINAFLVSIIFSISL